MEDITVAVHADVVVLEQQTEDDHDSYRETVEIEEGEDNCIIVQHIIDADDRKIMVHTIAMSPAQAGAVALSIFSRLPDDAARRVAQEILEAVGPGE